MFKYHIYSSYLLLLVVGIGVGVIVHKSQDFFVKNALFFRYSKNGYFLNNRIIKLFLEIDNSSNTDQLNRKHIPRIDYPFNVEVVSLVSTRLIYAHILDSPRGHHNMAVNSRHCVHPFAYWRLLSSSFWISSFLHCSSLSIYCL